MAVTLAVAWSVFAFGAVYPWAAPPLLAMAAAAVWLARARPRFSDNLDAAALVALAVIALQLVPAPPAVHHLISPGAGAFRAGMMLDYDPRAWLPLSLDPLRTRTALMLALAAYGLHLAVRRIGAADGRALSRWIAWIALGAALLGIGGRMLFPAGRIYWFWTPIEPGAAPFGAVINRNHFAAWAAMAAAVAAGGFAAQVARRRAGRSPRAGAVAAMGDARGIWLLCSAGVTAAAVVTTASRSGFMALAAATAAAALLLRRRAGGRLVAVFCGIALVSGIAVLAWAQSDRLLSRLAGTGTSELDLRQTIWRESAGIAAQYPVIGTGAGAFPAAMAYYQTGPREVFYNHAHNQYIEIATEGGLLLLLPLAIFAAAIVARARQELGRDEGSYVWLRIGAAAALAGLAVAAIWESPFRTPATLMLAAVASGLATAPARRAVPPGSAGG